MLSPHVLRRLRQLQLQRQATSTERPSPLPSQPRFQSSDLEAQPESECGPAAPQANAIAPAYGVQGRLPGEEIRCEAGAMWVIDRPVDQIWPSWLEFHASHLDWIQPGVLTDDDEVEAGMEAEKSEFCRAFPARSIFLDLETCGFAGSMVFLIGLIYSEHGRLRLVQLLARDYSEERALLTRLASLLKNRNQLVTFNGKSFDWPMIQDRLAVHRLPSQSLRPHGHFDLLHQSRRRWKHELPDCKLQTLEKRLCGRRRTGDVDGWEIPEVYQRFVRDGETTTLRKVLHHNALDLVTLLQLAMMIHRPD